MKKGCLALDSVSVRYDRKIVVSNVSIDLELARFHVIMGPNGGGKTTVIRAIAGLVPYEGRISIDGIEHKKYLRSNSIGYLAQRGAQFYSFPISAAEVVEMGRYRFRESKALRREKAMGFIEEVEMGEHASKPIDEMSGGQQQRILIARALATESKLLILDEPLTGMDPQSQSRFYEMIKNVKERFGLTIVMSSHDTGFTTEYADNVFCINKGLVPHKHAAKLLSEPKISKLYGPNIRFVEHDHLHSEEDDV